MCLYECVSVIALTQIGGFGKTGGALVGLLLFQGVFLDGPLVAGGASIEITYPRYLLIVLLISLHGGWYFASLRASCYILAMLSLNVE